MEGTRFLPNIQRRGNAWKKEVERAAHPSTKNARDEMRSGFKL
jgi:hypothetical protein